MKSTLGDRHCDSVCHTQMSPQCQKGNVHCTPALCDGQPFFSLGGFLHHLLRDISFVQSLIFYAPFEVLSQQCFTSARHSNLLVAVLFLNLYFVTKITSKLKSRFFTTVPREEKIVVHRCTETAQRYCVCMLRTFHLKSN